MSDRFDPIELHLPVERFEKLKAAEESERDLITRLVGKIARKRLRSRHWRVMKAEAELETGLMHCSKPQPYSITAGLHPLTHPWRFQREQARLLPVAERPVDHLPFGRR